MTRGGPSPGTIGGGRERGAALLAALWFVAAVSALPIAFSRLATADRVLVVTQADAVRARALAREGHLVGVFVEGTRQRFGHPGRMHPGGVMIAIQEGVPIVPCGLYSFGWGLRHRRPCALVWGEPIDLSEYARSGRGYREDARVVGEDITRLWRLAGEAVAGGFPPVLDDGSKRSGPVPATRTRTSRPVVASAG